MSGYRKHGEPDWTPLNGQPNKGEILMNDPHKFGTEFESDHALEQSTPIVSHHDAIKWFEAIPGEQLCIRVHGTQVNGRYGIMENIAAPGTATPIRLDLWYDTSNCK